MIDTQELRKVQLLQLKIAKEFKRICDKHEIAYSLSGGSLLGAVRHQGFIPWDDDFDVEMTRENYDHFLQVVQQELSDEFYLETWDTDELYANSYAKLMLKDTLYSEKLSEHVAIRKGIFIDIFPTDAVSDNKLFYRLQCGICDNLTGILSRKNGYYYEPQKNRLKEAVYRIAVPCCSRKLLKKLLLHFMTCCNKTATKRISLFGSCFGSVRATRTRDYYLAFCEYPFEDTTFKGFLASHEYLSDVYGNYMQFPPEDKRYNRHGIIKIDFGPYA